MGFGGTNFDWAAKTLTTTYDYAAPIREPGGLWDKYYAARGICRFLRLHGDVLTRAQALEGGAESTNPNVTRHGEGERPERGGLRAGKRHRRATLQDDIR